jgi:glycosyltransferase involved in cell wall biosynthesis
MKIAQIAPLYEAVPPKLYGGTERVVAHLADALVDLGHEVTLFAAEGSGTRATRVGCRDQPLRLDTDAFKSDLASHLSMLHEVKRRAREFDIIHFHIDLLHFPFFEHMAASTLTTLHGRLDMQDLPGAYRRWNNFPLVSISNDQRAALPFANWHDNISHGLCLETYQASEAPGTYLAFLGRISPEKRPDRAIALAIAAGIPLKIAAKVDNADKEYFDLVIKPLLDHPLIEFIGEITDGQKSEFLGNAMALVFPIDWPEPFGLVMIEAMACGTPVIAWRCGSVPEVIDEGITGFIVDNQTQALAAIKHISQLDRQEIRQMFEARFSAQVMAKQYVASYEKILGFHPLIPFKQTA